MPVAHALPAAEAGGQDPGRILFRQDVVFLHTQKAGHLRHTEGHIFQGLANGAEAHDCQDRVALRQDHRLAILGDLDGIMLGAVGFNEDDVGAIHGPAEQFGIRRLELALAGDGGADDGDAILIPQRLNFRSVAGIDAVCGLENVRGGGHQHTLSLFCAGLGQEIHHRAFSAAAHQAHHPAPVRQKVQSPLQRTRGRRKDPHNTAPFIS